MLVGLVLFSAAIGNQDATRVITSKKFAAQTPHLATTAELLERPLGLTDETFARKLIDASGLKPWNGQLIEFPAAPGRMGGKAVISGSGPEMTIYFLSTDRGKTGRVCRLTRANGGMSTAWTSAQDWCASKFGLPPLQRPPVVRTVTEPTRK